MNPQSKAISTFMTKEASKMELAKKIGGMAAWPFKKTFGAMFNPGKTWLGKSYDENLWKHRLFDKGVGALSWTLPALPYMFGSEPVIQNITNEAGPMGTPLPGLKNLPVVGDYMTPGVLGGAAGLYGIYNIMKQQRKQQEQMEKMQQQQQQMQQQFASPRRYNYYG